MNGMQMKEKRQALDLDISTYHLCLNQQGHRYHTVPNYLQKILYYTLIPILIIPFPRFPHWRLKLSKCIFLDLNFPITLKLLPIN